MSHACQAIVASALHGTGVRDSRHVIARPRPIRDGGPGGD